jgi:copper(I)-binding protein
MPKTPQFSILSFSLLLGLLIPAASVYAQSTSTTSVKKPTAPVVTPVAAPQAVAPVAPPAQPTQTATTSVTVGDLTVSHLHAAYKKGAIDVYMSIKNAGKGDERLGGADSALADATVVQVTKDKDGKEQEGPISQTLTADKTLDLTADTVWLRIKNVKAEPKNSDLIPLTLYFRRSPNAVLKIAQSGSESGASSVLDWLKK